MKSNTVKILLMLTIVSGMIFAKFALDFVINEVYVGQIATGTQNDNSEQILTVLNVYEPYIPYYNLGNSAYKKEDYSRAIDYYEKALQSMPEDVMCKAVANVALSRLAEKEKYNEDELKDIQSGLLRGGCADGYHSGRDEKSQAIYDALEQSMKGGQSGGNDDRPQSISKEEIDDDNLRELLKEQQIKSNDDHRKNKELFVEDLQYIYDHPIW